MKDILRPENLRILEEFAASNVLVGFDYDGTLAPIVSDPGRANMRPATRLLVQRLTRVYRCIVISGRAQDDVLKKVRGAGIYEAIGNHGLEPFHASNPLLDRVESWRPTLEASFRNMPGIAVEDKLFSIAVHYRRAKAKGAARTAILAVAEALPGARIVGGKDVINILPNGAPHKGNALLRERLRLDCETAIYIGDDETDEDVFRLDEPGRLLAVRVGIKRSSAANYYVRGQAQVDEFIRALLRARKAMTEPRAS